MTRRVLVVGGGIGGLVLATATTLVFVPVVYTLLRRTAPKYLGDESDSDRTEAGVTA